MNTILLASAAVGGVAVVVLIVWTLGWNEPARMESLEDARRVAAEKGQRDLSKDNAVLGDRGLTALFAVGDTDVIAVHTVGRRLKVVRFYLSLVETVTREGSEVIVEASDFGYPKCSIVLDEESVRRRWIDRLHALQ